MVTVQQVYDDFCFDVAEDGQLRLGIITEQQFLNLVNLVLLDWLKTTGSIKRIYTQTVFAGIGEYAIPDELIDVGDVFLGGRLLQRATVADLNRTLRDWKRFPGRPQYWYLDGLPINTIGLAPTPDYNGLYITGSAEPDPPHAQYDSFSAVVDGVTYGPDQHRGLTLVAARVAVTQVTSLGDPLPLIQDDFAMTYLLSGIEERIFNSDSELQDVQAGIYAKAGWIEGVNLLKAITGSPVGEVS